jgi:hypothetical protein
VSSRPAPCHCGGTAELRYCPANKGVAWQCTYCGKPLSPWIPHTRLPGIDLQRLPIWRTERVYIPTFQRLLFTST